MWVATTNGSDVRQITSERDPAVAIGVPMWSPAGNWIVFIVTRRGRTGLSVIHPDGSFEMRGLLGQSVRIVPSLDLIVAANNSKTGSVDPMVQAFLQAKAPSCGHNRGKTRN